MCGAGVMPPSAARRRRTAPSNDLVAGAEAGGRERARAGARGTRSPETPVDRMLRDPVQAAVVSPFAPIRFFAAHREMSHSAAIPPMYT